MTGKSKRQKAEDAAEWSIVTHGRRNSTTAAVSASSSSSNSPHKQNKTVDATSISAKTERRQSLDGALQLPQSLLKKQSGLQKLHGAITKASQCTIQAAVVSYPPLVQTSTDQPAGPTTDPPLVNKSTEQPTSPNSALSSPKLEQPARPNSALSSPKCSPTRLSSAANEILCCRCTEAIPDVYFECLSIPTSPSSNRHITCANCMFKHKLQNDGIDSCPVCSSLVSFRKQAKPPNNLWIFVDNSNLWVQAKRLHAQVLNYHTSENPLLRMDTGKLSHIIETYDGGRSKKHKGDSSGSPPSPPRRFIRGDLFGSEPPKLDTVWKKIRQNTGWHVHTYPRCKSTGREKIVDTKLVAMVTKLVSNESLINGGTIAIVSGDLDMMPCIDEGLLKRNWRYEIWMWKHATHLKLQCLADKYPNQVKHVPLDEFLEDITFTNFRFNYSRHWRKKLKLCTAVLLDVDVNHAAVQSDTWRDFLSKRLHWPFQYYFVGSKHEDAVEYNDIALVFRGTDKSDVGGDAYHSFDAIFQELLKMTEENANEIPWKKALTYVQYLQAANFNMDDIALSNYWSVLNDENFKNTDGSPCELDEEDSDPSEDRSSWDADESGSEDHDSGVAARSRPRTTTPTKAERKLKQNDEELFKPVFYGKEKYGSPRYSEHCNFGGMCKKKKHCDYYHTKDELWYFDKYNKRYRCRYGKMCRAPQDCAYAHNDTDSYCVKCNRRGHLEHETFVCQRHSF